MTTAKTRMTEAEFLRLPDDGRKVELVDGEARAVPAGFEHDIIGITVASLIKPYARGRGYVAGSQAGFRMASGNIRSPDVSFMLKSRLTDGKPSQGFEQNAPDLCIEIISPTEDFEDMERKVNEYFASGAQRVWQMFPETRTLKDFTSPTQFILYSEEHEIDGGALLPGFRCRVADLFALE